MISTSERNLVRLRRVAERGEEPREEDAEGQEEHAQEDVDDEPKYKG